ncbi:MAG: hypothetical protein E6446_00050 [Gemella haemolysans]|nr:hypothetical protein [Gemella haemolysans]
MMIILICVLVSFLTSLTMMIWHLRKVNKLLTVLYTEYSNLTLSLKEAVEE